MSIVSLTRVPRPARKRAPSSLELPELGGAAVADAAPSGGGDGDGDAQKRVTAALTIVAAYVPTEIIAFYTVVLAALVDLHPTAAAAGTAAAGTAAGTTAGTFSATPMPLGVLLAFVLGTPPVVWLVHAVQRVEAGLGAPWHPRDWPWWAMVSATIAFVAWSQAMPGNALSALPWYDGQLSGLWLVGVSLFLPLFGVVVTGRKRA